MGRSGSIAATAAAAAAALNSKELTLAARLFLIRHCLAPPRQASRNGPELASADLAQNRRREDSIFASRDSFRPVEGEAGRRGVVSIFASRDPVTPVEGEAGRRGVVSIFASRDPVTPVEGEAEIFPHVELNLQGRLGFRVLASGGESVQYTQGVHFRGDSISAARDSIGPVVVEPERDLSPVLESNLQRRLEFNVGCGVGFRVLASAREYVQHTEGVHLRGLKECGCRNRLEVGQGSETTRRNSVLDVDVSIGGSCREIVRTAKFKVLDDGKEFMQQIGGLSPELRTNCGASSSLEAGKGKEDFDMDVEQARTCEENAICKKDKSAPSRGSGNVTKPEDLRSDRLLASRQDWPDGLFQSRRNRSASAVEPLIHATEPKHSCDEASKRRNAVNSLGNDLSTQATPSSTPIDVIELVQSHEGQDPQNDLPSISGIPESGSQYPVPLSPMSGEVARNIEYERAMVAETAMKSGPAITKSGVLFEDEWLLVINKPRGIYSEHILATVPMLLSPTAARQARDSSLSRLTLRRPDKDTSGPHLHMANRLDRDTSGLMVVTKCRNAAGKMSNIFTKRQMQKSYIALCRGQQPSWTSLTIDSGHGRSRFGAWRVYSKLDVGRGLPGGSVVRDMTTHLLVLTVNKQRVHEEQVAADTCLLEEFKDGSIVTAGDEGSSGILRPSPSREEPTDSDEIVIRAVPLTGRTHQIRLHCQFAGLPLRGDVKYGGPHFLSGVRYDHHALHAESLSFTHPFTFEELHFVAPLPQWATDAGVQPLAF